MGKRTKTPQTGLTDADLLRRIARAGHAGASYKQLIRELGMGGGRERRLLLEQLARITARGDLAKSDRDHWTIPATHRNQPQQATGKLDVHRDGFGFVRTEGLRSASDSDVFIPPDAMQGAMQGDQVLVSLDPPKPDGRRSGRILRILTRRNATVVGIFHSSTGAHAAHQRRHTGDTHTPWQNIHGNYVTPLDERMTQPIVIPPGAEIPQARPDTTPHRVLGEEAHARDRDWKNLDGLAVDVEITDWPTPSRPARGRIIEVLGHQDDFGVDVEIVIRKHHLPHIFPEEVLTEARGLSEMRVPQVRAANLGSSPTENIGSTEQSSSKGTGFSPYVHPTLRGGASAPEGRRDFRDLPIVTIDGETARDFDDAVYTHHHPDNTWTLHVHIADVAHYVIPGSALDQEARFRGTSVYFPDRAIPMLPAELSTDLCSLRPSEDRLVLSCIMHLDPAGALLSYELSEGIIRSVRRMTYTQVAAILDNDQTTREEFAILVPEFERMYTLARILNRKRAARGSIDFDLPEPVIQFDPEGNMHAVVRSQRNWAHRLIEEFMLAANETVAAHLEQLGPSIYRIHEKPEARRVFEFEQVAANFGYSLGVGNLPVRKFTPRAERREFHQRGGRGPQPRAHEVVQEIDIKPQMYQRLAAKLAGKPEERILSYLMLRSLKQAKYSEVNEGHFALATPSYTHFTSPIRRYPDLIIHRLLKASFLSNARHPDQSRSQSGAAEGPPFDLFFPEKKLDHPDQSRSQNGAPDGPAFASPVEEPGFSPASPLPPQEGALAPGRKKIRHPRLREAKLTAAGAGFSPRIRARERKGATAPEGYGPQPVHPHQDKGRTTGSEGYGPQPVRSHQPQKGALAPEGPISETELAAIALESSQSERRADDAERELIEWKKMRFMQDRVGEDFRGLILSVTKYGLFVELEDLFVEGLVPIATLTGDYFVFRENTRQIVGERTGRRYAIGDQVEVILDRVDRVQRRMQFALVENADTPTKPRPEKKKATKKPKKTRLRDKSNKKGNRRK